jgi:hypothetical protein
MDDKFKNKAGFEVPYFPYKVTAGNVALAYEENYFVNKSGIEEPHKKMRVRTAVVVAIGEFVEMDGIVVGRKVLMPTTAKQEFEIDGRTFYVCSSMDIKVVDPVDDEEMMLWYMTKHFESMPESVQKKFSKIFWNENTK